MDGGHREERLLRQAKEREEFDVEAGRSREILATPATTDEVNERIRAEESARGAAKR